MHPRKNNLIDNEIDVHFLFYQEELYQLNNHDQKSGMVVVVIHGVVKTLGLKVRKIPFELSSGTHSINGYKRLVNELINEITWRLQIQSCLQEK